VSLEHYLVAEWVLQSASGLGARLPENRLGSGWDAPSAAKMGFGLGRDLALQSAFASGWQSVVLTESLTARRKAISMEQQSVML